MNIPWRKLSAVEIRRRNKAQFLICTPKFGSTPLNNEQAKQLWSEGVHSLYIIDVTTRLVHGWAVFGQCWVRPTAAHRTLRVYFIRR